MKKLLLILCMAWCSVSVLSAQESAEITCPEPEFIGETLFVNPDDGSPVQLEKQTVMMRSRVNATGIIFGIGKAKTKMIIEGTQAAVRVDGSKPIRLIVRAVDNQTDPLAIINIFRFECSKKQRLAELASVSTFGSVKTGKLDYVPYSGRKYGESSYLLTLEAHEPGEYGITVQNPNMQDEKSVIVSTFAIE